MWSLLAPIMSAGAPSGIASTFLGPVGQAMGALGAVNGLFGPQGAIAKGDIGGIAQGMNGLTNAFSSMPKADPTVQGLFGLSPEQFSAIPPEIKQALLQKAMGR